MRRSLLLALAVFAVATVLAARADDAAAIDSSSSADSSPVADAVPASSSSPGVADSAPDDVMAVILDPATGATTNVSVTGRPTMHHAMPSASASTAQSTISAMFDVHSLDDKSTVAIARDPSSSHADCIDRPSFSAYDLDGDCNNRHGHPEYGMLGAPYLRLLAPAYPDDGSGNTYTKPVVNARLHSNIVFEQASIGDVFDERGLSNWIVDFGQFFNHDRHLSAGSSGVYHAIESDPIPVPAGDSFTKPIPFDRSEYAVGTGTKNHPRRPVNMATTAWIDASPVYGTDASITKLIRGPKGTLKSQQLAGGEFPLFVRDLTLPDVFNPSNKQTLLAFAEFRGNEQLGLSLVQTIWFREHNRLARTFAAADSKLTSDQIFERARRMVIALMQKVTLDYFAALGVPMSEYAGYDGRDPSGYLEFISGAFRAGHSQIYDALERMDSKRKICCGGDVALEDGFFAPEYLYTRAGDLEAFVRGFSYGKAQAVDLYCVDAVRQLLFGPGFGMDLLAIDLQRAAEQGISLFERVRQALSLPKLTTLAQLTDDPRAKQRLNLLYKTTHEPTILSKLDLLTGGLAERHVRGSSLGATFRRLFELTLAQIRASDRWWFERVGSLDKDRHVDARMRTEVFDTDFGDIVARNSLVPRSELPRNIFFVDGRPRTPTGKPSDVDGHGKPSHGQGHGKPHGDGYSKPSYGGGKAYGHGYDKYDGHGRGGKSHEYEHGYGRDHGGAQGDDGTGVGVNASDGDSDSDDDVSGGDDSREGGDEGGDNLSDGSGDGSTDDDNCNGNNGGGGQNGGSNGNGGDQNGNGNGGDGGGGPRGGGCRNDGAGAGNIIIGSNATDPAPIETPPGGAMPVIGTEADSTPSTTPTEALHNSNLAP